MGGTGVAGGSGGGIVAGPFPGLGVGSAESDRGSTMVFGGSEVMIGAAWIVVAKPGVGSAATFAGVALTLGMTGVTADADWLTG